MEPVIYFNILQTSFTFRMKAVRSRISHFNLANYSIFIAIVLKLNRYIDIYCFFHCTHGFFFVFNIRLNVFVYVNDYIKREKHIIRSNDINLYEHIDIWMEQQHKHRWLKNEAKRRKTKRGEQRMIQIKIAFHTHSNY